MLNDSAMLGAGIDYAADGNFGENDQTYYGKNGKALWGWNCGSGQNYFQSGCTGSGAKDCRDPAGLVDGCPDYRGCCTVPYWVGEMLSALLLNAKGIWNHDAFFDFVDRWMNDSLPDASGAQNQFVTYIWNTYRSSVPVITPMVRNTSSASQTPVFKIGADGTVRTLNAAGSGKIELYDLHGRKIANVKGRGCFLVKSSGMVTRLMAVQYHF